MSDERLAASLAALGRELAYPPTPALGTAVTARITAPASARPVLPGRALWSRRRVLVLVAVGSRGLAIAAAARLAIGAFEIRVQPGATPSASQPRPFSPTCSATPSCLRRPRPPPGTNRRCPRAPSRRGLRRRQPVRRPRPPLRVAPERSVPADPRGRVGARPHGVPGRLRDRDQVRGGLRERPADLGDGRPAFWVTLPHVVAIETDRGTETFAVRGNVLVWQGEDGLSYRMETALDQTDAVALAESFR